MRIIAGRLKGQQFASPHGHRTHPMSDKMRGALFNILGDVEGLTFLDAFAGSGALSFEAVSHGASYVVAVERDRAAYENIQDSIKTLRLGNHTHATRAALAAWSSRNVEKDRYDILLLDPPYDELQLPLIQKLIIRHLKPDGLAVLSYPGKEEAPVFLLTEVLERKDYGDSQLIFYRKSAE